MRLLQDRNIGIGMVPLSDNSRCPAPLLLRLLIAGGFQHIARGSMKIRFLLACLWLACFSLNSATAQHVPLRPLNVQQSQTRMRTGGSDGARLCGLLRDRQTLEPAEPRPLMLMVCALWSSLPSPLAVVRQCNILIPSRPVAESEDDPVQVSPPPVFVA